jgi:hypothetical protein
LVQFARRAAESLNYRTEERWRRGVVAAHLRTVKTLVIGARVVAQRGPGRYRSSVLM